MKHARHSRIAIAAVAAAAGVLLIASSPAAAQLGGERIVRYDVDIRIEASGSIVVLETIEYDFGVVPKHGIFRDIPVRIPYDDTHDRIYPLTVVSVTGSPGTPVGYEIEDIEGFKRIRVGDADITITGLHTYAITYRVDGALNGFADHDELFWNAVGPDWAVPIERATVRIEGPTEITRIACFSGFSGSSLPCERARIEGGAAVFSQRQLPVFTGLTVVVALPKGAVAEPRPILDERWSLPRAFSFTPFTVGAASVLLVAVIALFGRLAWKTGRDRRYVGSQVDIVMGSSDGREQAVPLGENDEAPVEFAPPEGLKAGQIGTLIDEVANPLDITATIIDLAVRGYLTIEEIPKQGSFGKPDWKVAKLKDADDLLKYERLLFNGLFKGRTEVNLSALRAKFADRLNKVQDALYEDAIENGWFPRRPDKVRTFWVGIGTGALILAIVVLAAAIAWTHVALLPVPLVLGGLLLLIGARSMPRRTAKGAGLRRRVLGFRRVIETADTHLARFAEQENIFYRFLPYAIVFGCTEKWAEAFAALAEQPQQASWYLSPNPFALAGFSHAIDGFAVTTAGTLTSTPSGSGSSGFGGGGFSGGGGGGGGGGSW